VGYFPLFSYLLRANLRGYKVNEYNPHLDRHLTSAFLIAFHIKSLRLSGKKYISVMC
jgi:hypothetical protein